MAKSKKAPERSIVKGALAGLAGGIAGSAAKLIAEKVLPPRTDQRDAPPVVLAERVSGFPLSETGKEVAAQGIHWTFGAIAGAVYGAAVELEPKAAAWRGAAFGLGLNKLTHESLLPKMGLTEPGLSEPAIRQSTRERQSEWVTHAVFGVVTEAVRRVVRKGL